MIQNPLDLQKIKNPILRRLVQAVTRIDVLAHWYDDWLGTREEQDRTAAQFIDYTLTRLNVSADIKGADMLQSIPETGPVIITANHPLGGLEGMLLSQILQAVRPDLKVLTNEMLRIFPEFHDIFIGVDVLNKGKAKENARGIRAVSRHLDQGGALLVFPAGTVSHIKLPSLKLQDAPWNILVPRLARKYSAPIMPVFVGGKNALLFYLSAYIHKRLRTMLLPRAMLAKNGEKIPLSFGGLIPATDLQRLSDDQVATQYIRLCCKVLEQAEQKNKREEDVPVMKNIKADMDTDVISAQIKTLKDCLLYSQNNFHLYCAEYNRLGPVMEQLAIERERTFRQVEEGTGHECDSDQFDPHYMHLFLWDDDKKKIAGGYRIGTTDKIIKSHDLKGLYSHSLFDYNRRFINEMGNSIELGRSFITPDYQRHAAALDMLWKGIGHFVAQNPEYHTLFGCVSISKQYSKLVSALLAETFLSHYGVEKSVRRKVKARAPIENLEKPWNKSQLASLSKIPIINKLVGRIDTGKSIPVLIRHYLALNGRFVSFTVNNGFNRSLDGLIMVDLRKAPDKYLKRYMGVDGFDRFHEQWKIKKDAA